MYASPEKERVARSDGIIALGTLSPDQAGYAGVPPMLNVCGIRRRWSAVTYASHRPQSAYPGTLLRHTQRYMRVAMPRKNSGSVLGVVAILVPSSYSASIVLQRTRFVDSGIAQGHYAWKGTI